MNQDQQLSFFERFILKAEFRLVLLLLYIGALVFIGIRDFSLWSVLYIHLIFVFLLSFLYFGKQFIYSFFSPSLLSIHLFKTLFQLEL